MVCYALIYYATIRCPEAKLHCFFWHLLSIKLLLNIYHIFSPSAWNSEKGKGRTYILTSLNYADLSTRTLFMSTVRSLSLTPTLALHPLILWHDLHLPQIEGISHKGLSQIDTPQPKSLQVSNCVRPELFHRPPSLHYKL